MAGKLTAALTSGLIGTAAFGATGDLTVIPKPAAWTSVQGQSIDDNGLVLVQGARDSSGNTNEIGRWSQGGGHQLMAMPEGITSINGRMANNQGWVSGSVRTGGYPYPFRWSSSGGYEIATEVGWGGAMADNGDLALSINSLASVWRADGTIDALPTLSATYNRSMSLGMSSSGIVAGAVVNGGGHRHAVIWDEAGQIVDLNVPDSEWGSEASVVNAAGKVAGISSTSTLDTPFMWRNGVVQMLDGASQDYTRIAGIDERGNVVGAADDRAALWLDDGTLIDLTALAAAANPGLGSFTLYTAEDINENGLITGMGYFVENYSSVRRGYVLDVSGLVPEPTSLVVVAMSAGMLLRRRRGSEVQAS